MFSGENVGIFGGTNIAVSSGGTANFNGSSFAPTEAMKTLMSNVSSRGLHNSGEISDPPKCHPGTRIEALDILIAWAVATTYLFPIKWLTGPAGAGKSAIMRTFAEILVQRGLLLASFFFFRSDGDRNNVSQLISTIAYQICLAIPPIRQHIECAVDQFRNLIVDPLLRFFYNPNSITIDPFPRIILIDGLDECQGDETQVEILELLCKRLRTLPISLAIVIASRPEYQIRNAFDLGHLNRTSSRIVLDDSFEPDKDIEMFYLDKFDEMRRTHPMRLYLPEVWPSPQVIVILVRNASGQFIYASTVIKFIQSVRHNPSTRLGMILGLVDRGTTKPFQQLDLLYTTIFLNVEAEDLPGILRALGVILTPPISPDRSFQSPTFLERLLGYCQGEIRRLFIGLESLLTVASDNENIRIFHTSLADFLFDKARAEFLSIDKDEVYADIAASCINRCFWDVYEPMMDYIVNQFPISLARAVPTEKLRQTIIACDIEKLNSQLSFGLAWPRYGLRVLTPMFLDALQRSTFPDALTLHTKKVESFWNSLVPKLSVYWDDPALFALLMVSLTSSPDSGWRKIGVVEYLASLRLFLNPDLLRREQNYGLDLGESRHDPYPAEYSASFSRLTSELFMNVKGPAKLGVVQTQCANLAAHLLPYIGTKYTAGPLNRGASESHNSLCLRRLLPWLFNFSIAQNDLMEKAKDLLSPTPDSPIYVTTPVKAAIISYLQRYTSSQESGHTGNATIMGGLKNGDKGRPGTSMDILSVPRREPPPEGASLTASLAREMEPSILEDQVEAVGEDGDLGWEDEEEDGDLDWDDEEEDEDLDWEDEEEYGDLDREDEEGDGDLDREDEEGDAAATWDILVINNKSEKDD